LLVLMVLSINLLGDWRDACSIRGCASMALLEIRNLRVEIPTSLGSAGRARRRLAGDRAGEILGVVGESGAGKSMTGSAVLQLCTAGAHRGGEIRLEGERIDSLSTPGCADPRPADRRDLPGP
jgi:ABC-type glutathione transport system ATPase component